MMVRVPIATDQDRMVMGAISGCCMAVVVMDVNGTITMASSIDLIWSDGSIMMALTISHDR